MLSGIRQNKQKMKSVLPNFLPLVLENHFWRDDQALGCASTQILLFFDYKISRKILAAVLSMPSYT